MSDTPPPEPTQQEKGPGPGQGREDPAPGKLAKPGHREVDKIKTRHARDHH
jgi:hypothetical protein